METSNGFIVKTKKTAYGNTPQSLAKSPPTPQPLVSSGRLVIHHPKAGLNPLVDAASYLFSITGKLKRLRSYRNLNQLEKELTEEIQQFQENAKNIGYSTDFVLVSRYALSATLDDIITNTAWGKEGQWDPYRLQLIFNHHETPSYERFFLILERIIKEPTLYIDLMEFMYICLSLGFKGDYRAQEKTDYVLEQITDALYKRIRAYHGTLNKGLSPYPLKTPARSTPVTTPTTHPSILWGATLIATLCIALGIFAGLGYLLDTISNQAYQELMHIGKSILYETL